MEKKQPPFFIIIASLTTLTAVLWIVVSVINTFKKDSVAPTIEESVLQELSPVIDSATLDKLEKRVFFEDSFINEKNILVPHPVEEEILEPTPTPIP